VAWPQSDLRELLNGDAGAIGILVVNLIGDSLNAWLRHDPKTLLGLPIGGLIIWYLFRARN
jgi:hypothetical protein